MMGASGNVQSNSQTLGAMTNPLDPLGGAILGNYLGHAGMKGNKNRTGPTATPTDAISNKLNMIQTPKMGK